MIERFENCENADLADRFACNKSIKNKNRNYFVIGYVHGEGTWDVYEDDAPYCDEDFMFVETRWMNGEDFLD